MGAYVVRRLFQMIIVLIGVTFISFSLLFVTGDPLAVMLGDVRGMTEEQLDAMRARYGLDRPLTVQYVDFLGGLFRGDLGRSFYHRQPNLQLILDRYPATLQLGSMAFLLSIVISIPAGVIAAANRGKLADNVCMILALIGQAMPVFWLGLMLMMIFAVELKWLPVSGRGTYQHLILPAITLAAFSIARNARMIRSSVVEVLDQDYIVTARSKGLTERVVLYRHALKNALIPFVTLLGIQLGHMLGGAVITETIFSWPGVGRLSVQAINTRDIPLVQASVVVLALSFVLINLLVDLVYMFLDPRIRYT